MKTDHRIIVFLLIVTSIFFEGCSKEQVTETELFQFFITDYVTGEPIANAQIYRADCKGDSCEFSGPAYYSDGNGFVELPSLGTYEDIGLQEQFEIKATGYHEYLKTRFSGGWLGSADNPLFREYRLLPKASLKLTIIGNPREEEIRDYAIFGCYFREESFHSEIGSYIPYPIGVESICYGKADGFGEAYLGNWQGMFSECLGCYFGSRYPPFYDPRIDTELKVLAPGDTYLVLRVWLVTGPSYYWDTEDISKIIFIPRNQETEVVIDLNEYNKASESFEIK